MKFKEAQKELREKGITLKKNEVGEHEVNYKKGRPETTYYADSLEDAHATGLHYAKPENMIKEHEHPYWKKK